MGPFVCQCAEWSDFRVAKLPLRRCKEFPQTSQGAGSSQQTNVNKPHKQIDSSDKAPPQTSPGQSLAGPKTEADASEVKPPDIPRLPSTEVSRHRGRPPLSPSHPSPATQQDARGSPADLPAFKRDSRLFASLRERDALALKIKPALAMEATRNTTPTKRPLTPPSSSGCWLGPIVREDPEQRVNPTSKVTSQKSNPLEEAARRSINNRARGGRGEGGGLPRYDSEGESTHGSVYSEPAAG